MIRALLATTSIVALVYLAAEGVHAVSFGPDQHVSLLARAMQSRGRWLPVLAPIPPLDHYLTDKAEIDAALPELMEHDFMLGGTPYLELISKGGRLTRTDENGVVWNQRSIRVVGYPLRSRLFSPMAPIRLIGPADESLWPPGARRLRDRYGMRSFVASTDADGFRTTLPVRSGPEVVLLIGDSMAWGSGLDDSETLTSILQPKAPELRFVNAGVVTAQTPDNLAHLAEHLRAFGGRVRVVLYFFSETDMYSVYPDWPERSAGELVEAVRQICADHGVDRLVWIHGLTMSSTLPDVPAAFGGGSLREANRAIEAAMLYRRDVLSATEVLRIPVVDTFALVEAYRVEQQNHLAGLALYNDGMHFSREGMRRIAAEVVPHLPPSEDQTLSR